MRAIWAGLINLAIYTGNIVGKNRRKRGEKEHPVGLPRDVQYFWRSKIFLRSFAYNIREFTGMFDVMYPEYATIL